MHLQDFIAAIDIGNSQICCIITDDGGRVMGSATMASRGIKYGTITDLDACASIVAEVLSKAEKEANVRVKHAYVGICPINTKVTWHQGHVIAGGETVSENHSYDLDKKTFSIGLQANDYRIHCIRRSYLLDGKLIDGSIDGLHANDISMATLCVDIRRAIVDNIGLMLKKCHLHHYTLVFSPLAAAMSCLSDEEQSSCTCFLDMGRETTSYVCFRDNHIIDAGVIPIGGEHITKDWARGLNVSRNEAERIKTLHGSGFHQVISKHEYVDITPLPQYQALNKIRIPKPDLTHIIRARVEEIFERLQQHSSIIGKCHYMAISGGASELAGIGDLAGEIFKKHRIRLCIPRKIEQLPSALHAASFAGVLGLSVFVKNISANDIAPIWHRYNGLPNWRKKTIAWFRDYF